MYFFIINELEREVTGMVFDTQKSIHPTIRKCLQHLDIIKADDKTKQLVYMYMETLLRERDSELAVHQVMEEELPIQSQ
ncbi:hypothetical protein V7201_20740 [Bacillus sp. JJ1122]